MWSVIFVFLSYLDRNLVRGHLLDADKENKDMFSVIDGTLCARMSAFGENFLYQVSDGAEVVRSVVSPAGRLVHCSISVDQLVVKTFAKECRSGLKERRTLVRVEEKFLRMHEAKKTCEESTRRSGGTEKDEPEVQEMVLKRSKRGFTYPGTLWCGAGNMADTYEQLGDFAATDSCCRTHDGCPQVIHAFSSKYGYTNFKWHAVCHCDCDETLRDCLRQVNDTSSRVVGQAFFNVIGVPCFRLKYEQQCAERHWYGMCKRYERFPVAVIKEAVPYDYGGIEVIDKLTLRPPKKGERPESPTQPTVLEPEEPSLGKMVTAAEDFIKVLATVSTSQSSVTDSHKSESQTSEKKKKRRKNKGKKKKKTKKQKGKASKRKEKELDEGMTVSNAGAKVEEAVVLSNFIGDSQKKPKTSVKTESEPARQDETSNEVMKDEPVKARAPDEPAPPSPVSTQNKSAKKERRKKQKPLDSPEVLRNVHSGTNTTHCCTTTSHQTTHHFAERSRVTSEASSPIETPKMKRNRSKERGDREGWKKRKKISLDSSLQTLGNSSVEDQIVVPLSEGPTGTPKPAIEFSPIPDMYTLLRTPDPSFRPLKTHSKKRGGRNKRKKKVLPFSRAFSQNIPDALDPDIETSNFTLRTTEQTPGDMTLLNLRPSGTIRKQRRTKVSLTALPSNSPTTQDPNLQTSPKTSTAPPRHPMSPVQVSMERARDQLSWKKRRKAAQLSRQH